MEQLSLFVKKKRKQANLTQVGLAQRAGVGLRFIRELEGQKSTLRLDKVEQVLLLFGYEVGPIPVKRGVETGDERGNQNDKHSRT
jgi:y4mF family transcriptional regulator